MRLDVTVTTDGGLGERLRALGAAIPRAIARALNRTADMGRTRVVRALAEETGLAQYVVKPAVEIRRATVGQREATIQVAGRRIALMDFGARQVRAGVSYRGPSGRTMVPGAFIATMRSGHTGVFKRRTTKRLPIYELFGPSLPHVFRTRVRDPLRDELLDALRANLEHEIDFRTLRETAAAGPSSDVA